MYKFRDVNGLEDYLLENIGIEFLIPSHEKDTISFFHNGDKMTINTTTGEMDWDPVHPGEMFASTLSFRLHQWFGKGIIMPMINEAS